MSTKYLRPRRGKRTTAETNDLILKRGEVFFEIPTGGPGTGIGKIKMGDGVTPYSSLPYFLEQKNVDVSNTSIAFVDSTLTTNASLLASITTNAKLNTIIGAVKKLLSNLNTSVTTNTKNISTINDKVKNITISTAEADADAMEEGDIWITVKSS